MMQAPASLPAIPDHEREKASNGYLMSMVAAMVGLPLPIINLLATGLYLLGQRRQGYYVRFHCLQAFYSQLLVIVLNSVVLTWTIRILAGRTEISSGYLSFLIVAALCNLAELVSNIYAAIATRKGKDVRFWFFGALTRLTCKP
jgi:uncharacterized membrane protein